MVRPDTVVVEDGIEYRTNNRSMRRDTPVSEYPAPGVVRVLSYGDSIADGWGVREEQTYVRILERQSAGRIEVLNMYRGGCPSIAALHIRRGVERLRPHGVNLSTELLNDSADEARVRFRRRDADGFPADFFSARYVVGWNGHLLAPLSWSGRFYERSLLWSMATQRVGKLRNRLQGDPARAWEDPLYFDDQGRPHYYFNMMFDRSLLTESAIDRGFEQNFESIRAIHRYLDQRGIRFLLILIPSKYAFAGPFRGAALERFRLAEARATELRLPFVSVFDALREVGGDAVYLDFCHPTAAGNRAIAEAVLGVLGEWIAGTVPTNETAGAGATPPTDPIHVEARAAGSRVAPYGL